MKAFVIAVLVLLTCGLSFAQSPASTNTAETAASSPGCLIVKHKGTLGRRLLFTALIGVPIAPGAKYDLVEAIRVSAAKMNYKGKELETLQTAGVRVIVLETKYKPEDLAAARESCRVPDAKKTP